MSAEDTAATNERETQEVLMRLGRYEDEWLWHEQTDEQLAGYGDHMSQMLHRLPMDGQTRDMQASIEQMIADLRSVLASAYHLAATQRPDDREATLRAAVERVRDLHNVRTEKGIAWLCAEGECDHTECHDGGESPEVEFRVCSYCMGLADEAGLLDEFWPAWVMYPCATVAALAAADGEATK